MTLTSGIKVSLLNSPRIPVVSHVEPVREELVVNILNRLVQGDDMPCSCNLFLDSALFSTSRSWIPVVDAPASSERMSGLARCCRRDILEQVRRAFEQMLREIPRRPFERRPHVVLRCRKSLPSPT